MSPDDIYVVGLYQKQRALILEQITLQSNQSYATKFKASDFSLFNGGVLRVQIFRILRPLIWYERFAAYSQGLPPYVFTSSQRIYPDTTNQTSIFASLILGNSTTSGPQIPVSERTQLPNPYFYFFSVPKGELLIFKKPAETIRVTVQTDKDTY